MGFSVPLAPSEVYGGASGNGESLTTYAVKLQEVGAGGGVLSFTAQEQNTGVEVYLPGLDLTGDWSGAQLATHTTGSYLLFIVKDDEARATAPASAPVLSGDDAAMVAGFEADFDDIVLGSVTTTSVMPLPNDGVNRFLRVAVEMADSDKDGLTDLMERTLIVDGGTETNPYNRDSDDDEVTDGAEKTKGTNANDASEKPEDNNESEGGGGGGPALLGDDAEVIEVSFVKNHELTNDKGSVNYTAPHYLVNSHNYPVSYHRQQSLTLTGIVKIPSVTGVVHTGVKIEVFAPGGLVFKGVGGSKTVPLKHIGGERYSFKATSCVNQNQGGNHSISTDIGFHNAKDNTAYELLWIVSREVVDQEDALMGITLTKHTMYITDGKVARAGANPGGWLPRQETVFYYACKSVAGFSVGKSVTVVLPDGQHQTKVATALDMTKQIFAVSFAPLEMRRVIPTKAVLDDNPPMTYWGNVANVPVVQAVSGPVNAPICFQTASTMLKDPKRNGTCIAWAEFLNGVLRAHGYPSHMVEVKPPVGHDAFAVRTCLINNQVVIPAHLLGDPNYPFVNLSDKPPFIPGNLTEHLAGGPQGIPGQGDSVYPLNDPAKFFQNHMIVTVGGKIFDGAYGTVVDQHNTFAANLAVYETAAIGFFGKSVHMNFGGAGQGPVRYYRHNLDTGVAELTFKNVTNK